MEKKMIKVLDLFAGTQSVKKALDSMDIEYEYKGIDIYSPEGENLILDLAQDNIIEKLKEVLEDWKPDFIWASPICNKFSVATTGPKGNSYFIVENNNIRLRKTEEYQFVKHNKMCEKESEWKRYYNEAKLALKLHQNTKKIIDYFKIPFIIENPQNALTKYIYKDYIKNVCHYCAYGFEYKKPTAIYSMIDLNLLKHSDKETHRHLKFDRINKSDKWPSHWDKNNNTYANRSSVPPQLIKDIIKLSIKDNYGNS